MSDADRHGDAQRQDRADRAVAQPDSPAVAVDAEPVGERRAEGPGEDVGEPEASDRVPPSPSEPGVRNQNGHGEDRCRSEISELERGRKQITCGGSEREGRAHGRPVEQLAPGRPDAVDVERVLDPLPGDQHDGEDGGEADRAGGIRNTERHMQHVGRHRPEHGDHRDGEPVEPWMETARQKLNDDRHGEDDERRTDSRHRVDDAHQVVAQGFAERGRQQLDDPEQGRDLGDLDRHSSHASTVARRL